MKKVDIISKVVGRDGQGKTVGGGISIPLGNYALKSDFESLKSMFNDFLEGDDTDSVINRWKDLEAFLNGISEDNTLDSILKAYVTLSGTQTITGEKNFTGGLKVNGSPIVYDSRGFWKLEGDLLVTGGVSMYASDTEFTPSTIMDAIVVDNVTIIKQDGKLVAIGGGTGGGLADSVAWGNVLGKPSWITESAPIIGISGVNVSLGSCISQSSLRTALGLGSNAYTSTAYLPLSGGIIESSSGSPLRINSTHQGGSAIVFLHNGADKAWFGYDKNVGRTYMYNTASQSYLGVRDNGTPYYNSYTLWHSGNFTPANYLPLTGGTIETSSIALTINRIGALNSAIRYMIDGVEQGSFGFYKNLGLAYYDTNNVGWYKVWHENNDGSGSGLDADLLDGKHNGELTAIYVKSQNVTTDNFSTYLNTYGNQGLSVLSNMSGADVGDIPTICAVLNIGSTATRLGRFIFMRNDQSDGLWWQSANSAYNAWGTKRKVAFVDSNVASATKLQTTRYIWGRSFDGTGNITGDLEMGNNIILKQRDTGGNSLHTIYTSTSNNLVIGNGHAVKGYNTYLDGNTLFFRYGTTPSIGMILNSSGNVTIGSSDLASTNYKLYVDGLTKITSSTNIGLQIDSSYKGEVTRGVQVLNPSMPFGDSNGVVLLFGKGTSAYNCGNIAYRYHGENNTNNYVSLGLYGKDNILVCKANGNVGIDSLNPIAKLHVAGRILSNSTTGTTTAIADNIEGVSYNSNSTAWVIGAKNYYNGSNTNYGVGLKLALGDATETNKYFGISCVSKAAYGNVYNLVFESAKGVHLELDYNGNLLVKGGLTFNSMRSLKNIQDERGLSLDELSIIKPTRFTWKDGRDSKIHIGGIADDVQKVLPEVIYNMDNVLCMDYGNAAFAISASLIKPVVNHEERIKVLEEENGRLKREIEQLKWHIA